MHFFSEVSVKLSSLFIALFWTVELFQTMMQFTIALDPWKVMNKLEEFVVIWVLMSKVLKMNSESEKMNSFIRTMI
jgi:hypothetical protein